MPRDNRLYLDDIIEACGKILEYTSGMNSTDFAKDGRTVDAVVRNLEIIAEAASKLPVDAKEKAPEIEWHKIKGLRNILAHEYFGINVEMIWDIATNHISPLERAASKLLDE